MRARVIAPLVAAVLGISGGVATAIVVPDDDGAVRTSSFNDPLHLGIPLVDQDCTGEALLVVGYGDNVAPLGTAVANNGTKGVRYLRTDESCKTILGPERSESTPTYVVYLGPYDTLAEPCAERMTPEHRGDFVTRLRSGNQTLVKCACALPSTAGPTLRVGMVTTEEDVVWIRTLQAMLNDYYPDDFPHSAINGEYDARTAAAVTRVQGEARGVLTEPGVVDLTTWQVITDRICRIYDF
jgi:hypothetical protein